MSLAWLTTGSNKNRPTTDLFSLPEGEIDEVGDPRVGLQPAGGGELGAAVVGEHYFDLVGSAPVVGEHRLVRRD